MATIPNLLIDTDPGVDDAIALMIALTSPSIEKITITTVHGNVPIDQTDRNARGLVEMMDLSGLVEVFRGASAPLISNPSNKNAASIHGDDGLHGFKLPPQKDSTSTKSAVDAIIERAEDSETPLTIVTLGSLTNIAEAYIRKPAIADNISSLVMMGGAFNKSRMGVPKGGNIVPHAEFNIYTDPDAASLVLAAFRNIVMYPLNLSHQVLITPKMRSDIAALNTPFAENTAAMLQSYANQYEQYNDPTVPRGTSPMHDANTIIGLLHPELYSFSEPGRVTVETAEIGKRGKTDFSPSPDGNVRIATGADVQKVTEETMRVIRNLSKTLHPNLR